jgi:hypothetical protein
VCENPSAKGRLPNLVTKLERLGNVFWERLNVSGLSNVTESLREVFLLWNSYEKFSEFVGSARGLLVE